MFSKLVRLFKGKAQLKNDIKQILESVEEFKNRTIYPELTVSIIDSTPGSKLLQTVFDNLNEKISWDSGSELDTVLTFSKPQQAIFVIWCLECEVNNGGFNQLYFNSSGKFSHLMPAALRLIGANNYADLVTRANKTYELEFEIITSHQDGTLEGFSKSYEDNPLNKFDVEYYDLEKKENLPQLQIELIRNNKIDFLDTKHS